MAEPEAEYLIQRRLTHRIRENPPGIGPAMLEAIDAAAHLITPEARRKLAAIDYERELDRLRAWFALLLRREPAPDEIVAFHFGWFDSPLPFHPSPTGSFKKMSAPRMYAAAADRFDHLDPYCEWACDPVWFPSGRYPNSPVLRNFGRLCPDRENLAAGVLAGAFVASAAIELLEAADRQRTLGPHAWRAVGTGHDAGDGYMLGYITRDGFRWSPEPPSA